jgi:hypothetical protein
MCVMGAFTLAEIDATLARLKAEYDKLNHMEEYGLGGRQGRHRRMEEVRREIGHWERRRDRLLRGGIRARGAVVRHELTHWQN